ncbi:MAG: heme-binding protein, partial [Acidobacteria bacterium]|nr:heme-binding protein [Acidobacteriota bacterium]NIO58130.1 heme-binding protein [Acidobacteriota bacterium]NIQ29146.1 heme-binding protein [Acidobacteriota bacterium]NIQ83694.1 heme-binding protein [Acidobacteriota bacterium]
AEATEGPALYSYYFVMPSKYTLDSLPEPDDSRIEIREVPQRIVAVRRYSGRSNESNYRKNRETLLQALQ